MASNVSARAGKVDRENAARKRHDGCGCVRLVSGCEFQDVVRPAALLLLVRLGLEVLWRLVVHAAADEVLDDGVGVVGGQPGDANLAGADAGDGPVGDAGARVVAGGGFGDQGDAIAVGDRGQIGVGLVGDGSDADGVALAFTGGQPVVAPAAGFRGGGDERLVPQLVEGI